MKGLLRWVMKLPRKATKPTPGTVCVRPVLRMAGVSSIELHWPTPEETIAIMMTLHRHANGDGLTAMPRCLAMVLETLAGIPTATALRIALAYPVEAEGIIQTAFQALRSRLDDDDPLRKEWLPMVLAGEAA